MKVQQTIKKVGAVAASTLMVGMTMGAAQSLSDFPGMFTEDDGTPTAEIVVGSEGQVADVVGAVNVAAALGQESIQTSEETIDVEGTSGTVEVDGDSDDVPVRTNSLDLTVGDEYSQFAFFEEYNEEDGLSATEEVSVSASANRGAIVPSDSEAELAGDVRLSLAEGDVTYTADYTPSPEVGESIWLLGQEWEITDISSDSVEVGAEMQHSSLQTGDEIEHGDWSVTVSQYADEPSRVRVEVYQGGSLQDTTTLYRDSSDGSVQESFGNDDQFTVEVDSLFSETAIDLNTILTEEELTTDEAFFEDEDWDVTVNTDTGSSPNEVNSISLSNGVETTVVEDYDDSELDEDQRHPIAAGEMMEGPSGYFNVENVGLETEEDGTSITEETVSIQEDYILDYTDINGQQHELDLSEGEDLLESDFDEDEGYLMVALDQSEYQNTNITGMGQASVSGIDPAVPVRVEVDTFSLFSDDRVDEVDLTVEYGDASLDIDQSFDDSEDQDVDFTFDGPDFTVDFDTNRSSSGDPAATAFNLSVAPGTSSGQTDIGHALITDEHGLISAHANAADQGGDVTIVEESTDSDLTAGMYPARVDWHGVGLTASQIDAIWDTNSTNDDTDAGTYFEDSAAGFATDAGDGVVLTLNERNDDESYVDAVGAVYANDDGNSGLGFDGDVGQGQIHDFVATDGSTPEFNFDADQSETVTDYSTHVSFSDASELMLTHPTHQRDLEVAVGETTTSEGTEGETVEYEGVTNSDIRGTLDDMSMLDSEVTQSVRDSSDLILVGGPAVNTLVQDLAEDGDTWTADNWRNNHQDEALVQLVEDAFTDGQHALIVAGYQAQDTRAAANYISNYAEHASDLEGETQVTMTRGNYPGQ